jgi:hypothetical protein
MPGEAEPTPHGDMNLDQPRQRRDSRTGDAVSQSHGPRLSPRLSMEIVGRGGGCREIQSLGVAEFDRNRPLLVLQYSLD